MWYQSGYALMIMTVMLMMMAMIMIMTTMMMVVKATTKMTDNINIYYLI